MLLSAQTPRQRIIDLITGVRLSSYQLAQMLGIRERQVEEHLAHVVKTVAHDKTRRFILDPAFCQDCNFIFRDRRRLTSPSAARNVEANPSRRHVTESIHSLHDLAVDSSLSGR